MLRFPNCKINIGLYVTNRRTDGYHDLETVFFPLPLYDVLEIVPAKKTTVHLSGLQVNGDEKNNLVWKAYNILKETYPDKVPPLDIFLHKVIPMGAGLGGGSADGAFMLQMISDHCGLGLSVGSLSAIAMKLGSDCPFFIYNTPQFACGRGEKMEPIGIDLCNYSITVACPKIHVSTSAAFGMITPQKAGFDIRQISSLPVTEWKEYIANDFEQSIFKEHPLLKDVKDSLYKAGAVYASMSGSGSSLYGIFEKGMKADINSPNIKSYYIEDLC